VLKRPTLSPYPLYGNSGISHSGVRLFSSRS
jgi:hypothetical protein